MNVCPQCEQDVRPIWPTCRSCGALLMAPPAPVVPVGAIVTTAAPSVDEQFFAPTVLQPIVQLPPTPAPAYSNPSAIAGSGSGAGKWFALIGMVVFLVAAIATAWFTLRPAASAQHQAPAALAPRTPTAGLPTSLSAIVRIQAESSRHIALQTVEQVGNGDLVALASAQPNFRWIDGNQPAPDPRTVSVTQNGGQVIIAVPASNHDICAFGQWSPDTTPLYVTMEHEPTCAAVDAPSAGWSTQPGGANSDLPDDNG